MKIKLIAPFRIPGQAADGTLEVPAGTRVGALFRLARAPLYTRLLPVSVNGQQASPRQPLAEGDLVVVIAPISGG